MKCVVDGCDGEADARGWCKAHWKRWRKTGDVQGDVPLRGAGTLTERFWAKVDKRGPDECWPWLAYIDRNGYGKFSVAPSRPVMAHRYAYEVTGGTIPEGLTLDHLCHTHDPTCPGGVTCPHRRCMNPTHLEAVPRGVNTLRGKGPSALHASKKHCPQGHLYSDENTYIAPGGHHRQCRACRTQAS